VSIEKYRPFFAATTLIFMAYTLHNIFEGSRPIDWLMLVIEGLVLLLILYETVSGGVRRRREKKMRSFLDARSVELSKIKDGGERLKSIVPRVNFTSTEVLRPWIESVEVWTKRTEEALSRYSNYASLEFMRTEKAVALGLSAFDDAFSVDGRPLEQYESLVIRLKNLERILERPEAYFKQVVKPKNPS
jgi:hypothetical protein